MQPHHSTIAVDLIARLRAATDIVFDVDLTLTERQKNLTSDLAQTIAACGKRCGIATSRACSELDENINPCGIPRSKLFSGPVILEDGASVIYPGEPAPRILASPESALAAIRLKERLAQLISGPVDQYGYSQLKGLEDPRVRLAPYDYKASFSLWQRSTTTPPSYPQVMDLVRRLAGELQILDQLDLLEIGDGTLRAAPPGLSKGAALRELNLNRVIDLSKTIYFGDGNNDISAAHAIKEYGGIFVATDLHCTELVGLADVRAPSVGNGPRFVRTVLSQMINR